MVCALHIPFWYTSGMDEGQVVWDAANRKHLTQDHPERGITVAQVNQAMTDESRVEGLHPKKGTHEITGVTATGRGLYVAYVRRANGDRYPIHARPVSRRKPR
jgi:hypothetical protein